MLKGEVYLWSGKQMNGGESDYTTAKNALMAVKTAGVGLLNDFKKYLHTTIKKMTKSFSLYITEETNTASGMTNIDQRWS